MKESPGRSTTRALAGGLGLLTLSSLASRLLGLVSSPILTRVAGPEAYGVVALAGTLSHFAVSVGLLGLDLAYARFFFDRGAGASARVEAFCWRTGLALAVLAGLLTALVWRLGPGRAFGGAGLPVLVGVGTALAMLSILATTRRRIQGRYGRMALAALAGAFVACGASILLALVWRPDALAMLTGTALGALVTLGLLGLPSPWTLRRPSGLSKGSRRDLMALGLASAVTGPMFWVLSSTDRWLLDLWWGKEPTGVYAYAASLGLVGTLVNGAVTLVWFPEVSRDYGEEGDAAAPRIARLLARLLGLLMFVWLGVSAVGGDLLRLMADRRFHGGAALIPWMAGGVLFAGLAHLANTGPFLRKDLRPTVAWWCLGAAGAVVLQALLVPVLGPLGAAMGTTGGFALVGVGLMASAQSQWRLPLPWGRLVTAAGAVLILGLLLGPAWHAQPLWSLVVKLPALAGAGLLLGAWLAPDWMRRLLREGPFRAS